MYYYPKKKMYEEKELVLTLCKTHSHLSKHIGKTKLMIDKVALEMGEQEETSLTKKELLDCGSKIEYQLYLKRLDGTIGEKKPSAKSVPQSVPQPTPTTTKRPLNKVGSQEESSVLAESPLQPIEHPSNKDSEESSSPVTPPTLARGRKDSSKSFPDITALNFSSIPAETQKPAPEYNAGSYQASSARLSTSVGRISLQPTPDRSSVSFANAPSPITSYHSRTPSGGTGGMVLGRQSESVVEQIPKVDQRKKKILAHAHGHRRGKSHAVTPDELKGLVGSTGNDFRTNSNNPINPSPAGSASNIKRKSKAHLGKKAFAHVGGGKRNSTSNLGLSPRGDRGHHHTHSQSSSATPTSPTSSAQSLLIVNNDDSSSEEEKDNTGHHNVAGVHAWLASPVRTMSTPGLKEHRRVESLNSIGDRSSREIESPGTLKKSTENMRKSDEDAGRRAEELEAYKRKLAEQNKKRDQTYIYHQFVAFTHPSYTSEMSLSAYVLFRCVVEWDCFNPDEPDFREQLLEGFEKLSKSQLEQNHSVYWLSTVLSLLNLLRNNLNPIARSEVAKSNALVVFQERLRGLASAFLTRVVTPFVNNELKPVLSLAILEQHSLDDAGPSTRKNKAAPKVTINAVLKSLDDFLELIMNAKIASSIVSQVFARVSHAITAHTLNVLLDNNPGLCTFSNGLQMKKPISELRGWFTRNQFETAASLLNPLEEIVNVLCMNKSALVEAEVRKEVCPHLTDAQLGQLLLLYTPDDFDSSPVHPGVLAQLCGDINPNDYKMSEEYRVVLSLDMTDCVYELSHKDLPDVLQQMADQPSLGFLTEPFKEQDGNKILKDSLVW